MSSPSSKGAFDLDGHVSLITGGNGGIGLGIAHGLARAGAGVVIWGTNPEKNNRAEEELAEHGGQVETFVCDVSDEKQVAEAVAATLQVVGRIDSCFANAGIGGDRAKFHEMAFSEWRRVMQVNLDGAFLTLRGVAAHMVDRGGGGSLVATSSLTAIEAAPMSEPYAASKAGLIGLMRTLAVELARHSIRANVLMPGWIETELTAPFLESDVAAQHVLPRVPARRWGTPADVAATALYLASPASSYHTGDVLVIDGGYRLF